MRLLSAIFAVLIIAAPASAQRFPTEGFADLAEQGGTDGFEQRFVGIGGTCSG